MKIGINMSFLYPGRKISGIGQYLMNLLEGLNTIGVLQHFYLLVREDYQYEILKRFPKANIITIKRTALSKLLSKTKKKSLEMVYFDQFIVPEIAYKHKLDILFFPFHFFAINPKLKIPSVTMMHDLLYKHYPPRSKLYLTILNNRFKHIILESTYIIAPSNFVRKDIIKYHPNIDSEKIKIIHNPVLAEVKEYTEYNVRKPYILSVNSLDKHKNLETLIQAFISIKNKIKYDLVLVGGGDTLQLENIVREHNLEDRIFFTGYVSDKERNYLYQHADLFISPSMHEGFGYTPIEAMIEGVPTLTTQEASLFETTMGLAEYYGPANDAAALAERILEIVNTPKDHKQLSKVSNIILNEYSFVKIAGEYYEFFTKLLDTKVKEG